MQFPEKLTNYTSSENLEKPDFGLDFGPFGSELDPKFSFVDFSSSSS